jgi:hypothetical protein|tara:strand:- start:1010 stop:1171 length:162 start_codon:yes stop_codon:yes gene_type:complete
MLWKMIDSESKPKVRKKLPTHALTKKHKNKKKYNRKEKGRKADTKIQGIIDDQ